MTADRDQVHQLVDELEEETLPEAAEALRGLVQRRDSGGPRRQFRFTAGLAAGHDLAARSGNLVRDELGHQ